MQIMTFARTALLMGAMLGAPVGALAQDPPEEQEARRALNMEQARLASEQIARFNAEKQAIADEQAAKEQAYRDALAEREALIAATQKKALEDRARWEAAVTACLAGDYSQCAQPTNGTTGS